jgi:hypothetical protein
MLLFVALFALPSTCVLPPGATDCAMDPEFGVFWLELGTCSSIWREGFLRLMAAMLSSW